MQVSLLKLNAGISHSVEAAGDARARQRRPRDRGRPAVLRRADPAHRRRRGHGRAAAPATSATSPPGPARRPAPGRAAHESPSDEARAGDGQRRPRAPATSRPGTIDAARRAATTTGDADRTVATPARPPGAPAATTRRAPATDRDARAAHGRHRHRSTGATTAPGLADGADRAPDRTALRGLPGPARPRRRRGRLARRRQGAARSSAPPPPSRRPTSIVPARRGAITDRNGTELAVSQPAMTIAATPYLIKDPPKVAAQLAGAARQARGRVLRQLARRDTGFVYLARNVPAARAPARCRS